MQPLAYLLIRTNQGRGTNNDYNKSLQVFKQQRDLSYEYFFGRTRKTSMIMIMIMTIIIIQFSKLCIPERDGDAGGQQSFKRGCSAPRSNPLPFYIPFLTTKVCVSYTFHRQMVLLSHT